VKTLNGFTPTKKMPSTRMATAALLRESLVKAQNYLDKLEKANDGIQKKRQSVT